MLSLGKLIFIRPLPHKIMDFPSVVQPLKSYFVFIPVEYLREALSTPLVSFSVIPYDKLLAVCIAGKDMISLLRSTLLPSSRSLFIRVTTSKMSSGFDRAIPKRKIVLRHSSTRDSDCFLRSQTRETKKFLAEFRVASC